MKNLFKGYELGIISGFLFGIFLVVFLSLGLVSRSIEIAGSFLMPVLFPLRHLTSLGWSTFLNGVLFAFVGVLIQYFLRKRKLISKMRTKSELFLIVSSSFISFQVFLK